MRRSPSLRVRVAIASAVSATIVIAAIAAAFAIFLRVNGSEQLDRTLDSVVLAAPTVPAESVGPVPAAPLTPAMPADDATRTESLDGMSVRARDVLVAGDPGAMLSVVVPEDPLIRAIKQQQVWVVLAAATAIAAAAGLGWYFAGRAVRPLQRLAAATHTVGEEPGAARPNVRGAREAEDLSDAIGQMLDRIAVAKQRTEHALESSREFAATAAHELRTPLTAIRTDLEVLAAMSLTDAQRAEIVRDLLTSQRQVETTLTDLQRLAVGELSDTADHEELDLVDLADRCVQESSRIYPNLDITLQAPGQVVVKGIPTGLRLVLHNAITNAVRHGGAQRVDITVSTEPDDSVVVTVDDDGIGVPQAERVVAFDRFVRGAAASADGSGLGLALVAQQASLHGGTAMLADSPLGGARLVLRLPQHYPRQNLPLRPLESPKLLAQSARCRR